MSYTVNVTREDGAWIADAPAVPGAHTWARNLVTLESDIREAIALALDLPEDATATIPLDLQFETDDIAVVQSALVRRLRKDQQELEERIAHESRTLLPALIQKGFSVRDISVMLAISPGRVSQLTAPSDVDLTFIDPATGSGGIMEIKEARAARQQSEPGNQSRKGTSSARSSISGRFAKGGTSKRQPLPSRTQKSDR